MQLDGSLLVRAARVIMIRVFTQLTQSVIISTQWLLYKQYKLLVTHNSRRVNRGGMNKY